MEYVRFFTCQFHEVFNSSSFTEQLRATHITSEVKSSCPEVFCKKGVF